MNFTIFTRLVHETYMKRGRKSQLYCIIGSNDKWRFSVYNINNALSFHWYKHFTIDFQQQKQQPQPKTDNIIDFTHIKKTLPSPAFAPCFHECCTLSVVYMIKCRCDAVAIWKSVSVCFVCAVFELYRPTKKNSESCNTVRHHLAQFIDNGIHVAILSFHSIKQTNHKFNKRMNEQR